MNNQHSRPNPAGFTLVELLVVVGIIALLLTILIPSLGAVRSNAAMTSELSTARQMLVAYRQISVDNQERLLPGYKSGLVARDDRGELLSHPTNARYPWRLLPALGYSIDGLYSNASDLARVRETDRASFTYRVSLHPALGLNATFMGGDESELGFDALARRSYGQFYAVRAGDVRRAADQIVFASARATAATDSHIAASEVSDVGWHLIRSPWLMNRRWQLAGQPTAGQRGFVDARYGGRAVVGTFDGRADARTLDELDDMRLWAPTADRPDWTLRPR